MSGQAVRSILVGANGAVDTRSTTLTDELAARAVIPPGVRARVYRRYDLRGISGEELAAVLPVLFADPAEEEVIERLPPEDAGRRITIAAELLPGQFDQRADAAEQALRMLGFPEAEVKIADIYLIEATAAARTPLDRSAITSVLVNPVERRLLLGSPDTRFSDRAPEPEPPRRLPEFLAGEACGFSFSDADRECIVAYFRDRGHEPSETELALLATYWSDHCRHTTFRTELSEVEIESEEVSATWARFLEERRRRDEGERPLTLMEIATAAARWSAGDGELPEVILSGEVNAATVEIDARIGENQERWAVLFKNETHNHPTEIEPFGGAATCLGGAIRDPLSGRAYVYQAMRLSAGADPNPREEKALPGKLSSYAIARGAAAGYSSYGNQIGIATGLVDELYHPGYRAKRFEMGAVVGAAPAAQIRREEPVPGDLVLLIGGRTGRDGVGGATGSSRSHDERSIERAGAEVQKGNPPIERALQRLFRRTDFARLVKRSNDFGAGGVAVAVGEIAPGVAVDLDRVPLKYDGLTATEIAISESQERMAVVVAAEDLEMARAFAAAERLEATPIATITAEPRLVMRYRGEVVVEIDRDFLESAGAMRSTSVRVRTIEPYTYEGATPRREAGVEARHERGAATSGDAPDHPPSADRPLPERLGDPRYADRRALAERFDASIGGGALLAPYGGRFQRSPAVASASRLPHPAARTATVMAWGFDPDLSASSPYHGAYTAVVEALARLAATGVPRGGEWLSLQEYFPRPDEDPDRWGLPLGALLGAFQAQLDLGVRAIGGKDSMSGSYETLDVPPTLVAVALGVTEEDWVRPSHATLPGAPIVLLPVPSDERGLPSAGAFLENRAALERAAALGLVTAATVIRADGVDAAVARMCFGEHLGFVAETGIGGLAAGYGSILVELAPDTAIDELGVNACLLGRTQREPVFEWGGRRYGLDELYHAWHETGVIETVYGIGDNSTTVNELREYSAEVSRRTVQAPSGEDDWGRPMPSHRGTGPGVLLPVFYGTNCEDDTRRAFERAGARVDEYVVDPARPEEFARRLAAAQILMLPGGFSAGDEPAGSGKYIAALLRSPAIREVLEREYIEGDRLILGVCNGFQAMIRLGLVPFGRIVEREEGFPILAPNSVGHHVARHVVTRLRSNRGPWLDRVPVGTFEFLPVSHGEGRFAAAPERIETLLGDGQVATQYVDWSGEPTDDRPWNPNGSLAAVEGLTSPDGRFFGRMAHSERVVPGGYRNLPAIEPIAIFENGVRSLL